MGFMPHGHCYLWTPGLLWLQVGSDAMIALAYLCIPALLAYFLRRRTDLPYPWLFAMFGVFILSCGATHLFSIWNVWHADYWAEGWLKALTAVVSLATTIALVPVIPRALALRSPAELEQEILERARAEAALQQEQRRLQHSNTEIARFTHVASHELRQPLRRVAGYTQLLERHYGSALGEDAREWIRGAVSGVREMDAMIDEMLAYSPENADPRTLPWIASEAAIGDVIERLAPTLQASGARVRHGAWPMLRIHRAHLVRLLEVLIDDMIEQRRSSSPDIELTAESSEAGWVFGVRDSGAGGVDRDGAGRALDDFAALCDTLGRKILFRYGGELWVEHQEQGGLVYRFTLPLATDAAEPENALPAAA